MSGRIDTHNIDIGPGNIYGAKNCPADVAWGSVIGGAFTAVAVSFVLIILGSALGLSAMPPWTYGESSVTDFTIKTAIWLIVMQWIASGLGGYLTGRLRGKWEGMHEDEVFFRDTAHGFLAWAVATVITAASLALAAAPVISGGAGGAAAIAANFGEMETPGAVKDKSGYIDGLGNFTGYYMDSLFRPLAAGVNNAPAASAGAGDARAEAARIMAMGIRNGNMPGTDKAYLAQLVSGRTGLGVSEASRRVDEVASQINAARDKLKKEAEAARKTAMHVSIYLFLSLLVGAFIASSSAALGGRHRDEY